MVLLLLLEGRANPEEGLLAKRNRQLLAPLQEILQTQSAVLTTATQVSVGYGAVVSPQGHILTKASLWTTDGMLVRVGRQVYTPELLEQSEEWDLALLKVPIEDGTPVEWETGALPAGELLVSNGVTSLLTRHVKFGVVAAKQRPVPMSQAVLDLQVAPVPDIGWQISAIRAGGGAAAAGVQVGDVLTAIDGQLLSDSPLALAALLRGRWPGETVTLTVLRQQEELELGAPLYWQHEVHEGPQDRNEAMSGRVSQRRTGFPLVLQHDIPLSARTVGGPLLNLAGQCVGLNIARYSRAETYAIPAAALVELLAAWGVE